MVPGCRGSGSVEGGGAREEKEGEWGRAGGPAGVAKGQRKAASGVRLQAKQRKNVAQIAG